MKKYFLIAALCMISVSAQNYYLYSQINFDNVNAKNLHQHTAEIHRWTHALLSMPNLHREELIQMLEVVSRAAMRAEAAYPPDGSLPLLIQDIDAIRTRLNA